MSFDPQKPYNDLPLLPPKQDIETWKPEYTCRSRISVAFEFALG